MSGLAVFACLALSSRACANETPLPPLGTPLAESVDELTWRSARGQPEAACRLAMELGVCAVDLHRSWLLCKDREGNPTICRGHHNHISPHDREVDWPRYVDDVAAHCEGAPVVMPRELLAKFRRAAFLGSVTAMRYYRSAPEWMRGRPMSLQPSIWPEGSTEARAHEQHQAVLALALFNAGDAGLIRHVVDEANWRVMSAWDEDAEHPDPALAVEAMSLMLYGAQVVRALGWERDGFSAVERSWAGHFRLLSEAMSPEQVAQAEERARQLREAITLLPDQEADADRVRRNVDGTRYGGVFAPSAMARCNLVVPAP